MKMTPEVPETALPEPMSQPSALTTDHNDDSNDNKVIDIANSAAKRWNDDRQSEVKAAKSIQNNANLQSQMAHEIFMAVIGHLHTVPEPVRDIVIAKFKALPDKVKLVTLD